MKKIEVYEVGPRDGFQSIGEYIPLETKIQIIDGLLSAGIKHLQITSFVSPKAIPQMKDARDLAENCVKKHPEADFFALVPNLRGAEAAWKSGLKWITYVVSLSESHNRANINRSHNESFAELQKILKAYADMDVCLDLATTFGCPFEGKKREKDVLPFLEPYVDCGIRTVNLCDTIGIANPAQVRNIIDAVRNEYPSLDLQVHIHDTRNMGMVNTLAAIEQGVCKVQSTLGGLGGCPYAPGASGNLATEDLAFMLSEMGYEINIDVLKMIELARYQAEAIPEGQFSGHLYTVTDRCQEHYINNA
ncbi:MAG: hydroxymethylglutaryl-CoA lyase [Deltaproteobacteria bacterium]|nr:MAG: hydroxymethylglutaryl-CoA lyase [Deltaproteobacteria bacterium]